MLTWRNLEGYPAQPGLICFSVHHSVCQSVRAKRGIWSKRVSTRTKGKFSYQHALKVYEDYSQISTCTESSQYFLRNDRDYKAVYPYNARKRYAVIKSSDMRNIPWLASCFCIKRNPIRVFLGSKCDWRCLYFDTILAIYP